ncbi:hypothetical protein [Gluconobacter kondonii]|uniref:Uncharacterized protein n=1 Tax=Gluconobacter kondonii TaxID=941463 RepID=A0ABQ5WTM2_9PROT|nr:hypothetical protein [Gluconobacter kondonii]GLQ66908.1 hypothetical protein GCM10007870_24930 [Gluconobacter kondonii]
MKYFIVVFSIFLGILYPEDGISHEVGLLKYNIYNSSINDTIKYIGKNLPMPLEMVSNIFGIFPPLVRANDNFILYNGKTDKGGVSKIDKKFITIDGYYIDFVEEKMFNPPYISEILIGFNSSKKCLNPDMFSSIVNNRLYISEIDFLYSSVINNFIKININYYDGIKCVSSIDLKNIKINN